MEARELDFVQHLYVASTHAYFLFFTNRGRVHWLKVHELPQLGRTARGKALVNVLRLGDDERVQTMLPVRSFEEVQDNFVLLCTRKGIIKKTSLSAYANPRRGGIISINLSNDDELISVGRTSGQNEVIIATQAGKSIRFNRERRATHGPDRSGCARYFHRQ